MSRGENKNKRRKEVISPAIMTGIMMLPLELRQQIFKEIFRDDVARAVSVLQVSKQIYVEAQPYLFRRPLSFADQYELLGWMSKVGPQHLSLVQNLSFGLADVHCHHQLRSLSSDSSDESLTPIDHLYISALHQLSDALAHLSSITTLAISRPPRAPSAADPLYQRFVQSFFSSVLPCLYSGKLRSLSFETISHLDLAFLSQLPRLRHLRFSGYSMSGPYEALTYFQQVSRLTSLDLIGPPPGLTYHQRPGYTGPMVVLSITPSVIVSLSPLTSLSITEHRDPLLRPTPSLPAPTYPSISSSFFDASDSDSEEPPHTPILDPFQEVFLSSSTFSAIHRRHRHTLTNLSISSSSPSSALTTAAFSRLLSSLERLTTLSVDWCGKDPVAPFLCDLPGRVRRLDVGVRGEGEAREVAEKVVAELDWLPGLKDFTFLLDDPGDQCGGGSSTVRPAMDIFQRAGVRAFVQSAKPRLARNQMVLPGLDIMMKDAGISGLWMKQSW